MSDQADESAGDSDEEDSQPTRLGELLKRRPIMFALGFESALAVAALALALLFGLQPWLAIDFTGDALVLSMLATAPLIVGMLALMQRRWGWVRALRRIVEDHLLPLFRDAGPLAVLAVALMAGIGEELLFRGVIQAGLEELIGPLTALIVASLLFGVAHAVSPAYFALTCVMGIYLGWLYQATGNLLVPITVHFLYDWVVLAWYLRRTPDSR